MWRLEVDDTDGVATRAHGVRLSPRPLSCGRDYHPSRRPRHELQARRRGLVWSCTCGVSVKGRRSRFLRFPAPRFKNTGGSRDTHGTDTRHTKLPDRYATYCTLKYDLKPLRNLATGTVPVIRDFMVAHATLRCDARTHARNEKSSVSSWQLLAA
jgi:hypothetical protein